jgi:hypothetical protein
MLLLNLLIKINRFGMWNFRSMHRAGSLRAVAEEISKYKLELLGSIVG